MLWCCGSNERCRKGWGCDTSPRRFDPQLHADASSAYRQRPSQVMREVWQVLGNRWHDAPSGAWLRVRQLWGEEMNCRPGDLAVIVRSAPAFERYVGKIVVVVKRSEIWNDCWVTDPRLFHFDGFPIDFTDSSLRPIRDSDGEDEMLRIAGKPQEVNA